MMLTSCMSVVAAIWCWVASWLERVIQRFMACYSFIKSWRSTWRHSISKQCQKEVMLFLSFQMKKLPINLRTIKPRYLCVFKVYNFDYEKVTWPLIGQLDCSGRFVSCSYCVSFDADQSYTNSYKNSKNVTTKTKLASDFLNLKCRRKMPRISQGRETTFYGSIWGRWWKNNWLIKCVRALEKK